MTRMKIVCISDTHGIHDRMLHQIPKGDILLHAGDITRRGRLEDLSDVEQFFGDLPHPHKVFTPGNHDWCFEREREEAVSRVSSASCLIDEEIDIGGLKIWGSPWQPEFHDWAFNLPRGKELADVWAKMPDDCDIVITHGPPRGIGDRCSDGRHEGCDDLRQRIAEVRPKLHLFGHIHEAYGVEEAGGTVFANASICNLAYRPVHEPVVIHL